MRAVKSFLPYLLVLGLFGQALPVSAELAQFQSSPFYRHLQYLENTGQQNAVISEIMKDEKLGRLKKNKQHVQLMLGRLYLSLGLHFQAGKIFQQLVKLDELNPTIKNEVWFYLAKSYYHLGYLEQSDSALAKVVDSIAPELRAEKRHLQALILMSRQRFREAADLIQKNWWQAPGNWDLYARFNLAVALINSGQNQQGMELLKQIGLREVEPASDDSEEALALSDKANQALGYLLLNANKADQARPYLEKVRLKGPYSNLALLGAGWASARLQQYKQALVPWHELSKRDVRDTAVQEAFLTVPYAYEQLGMGELSVKFYQLAIDNFIEESKQIDISINDLKQNQLQQVLETLDVSSEKNWLASIQQIDNRSAARYLQQSIESDEFFNVLINYREASYLLANSEKKLSRINQLVDELLVKVRSDKNYSDKTSQEQIEFIQLMASSLLTRTNSHIFKAGQQRDKYADKLKELSLQLLQQRKQRLDVYLVQARLALAQAYDKLEAQRVTE